MPFFVAGLKKDLRPACPTLRLRFLDEETPATYEQVSLPFYFYLPLPFSACYRPLSNFYLPLLPVATCPYLS